MIRVAHAITRLVRGGAQQIVLDLVRKSDHSRFSPFVVCGDEDAAMRGDFERVAPIVRIPALVRRVAPGKDARALAALFREFRRSRPHVVHGHTYKAGVLASIAARHAGVRAIVFTPHGHIFTRGARIPCVPQDGRLRLLRALTRYAQSCAHVITALSDEDLREQLSHGLAPRGRYRVIRNGIDVERFRNGSSPSQARKREWVVGSVGRLTEEKGHRHLLPMLKALPGARLVIVGEGPERGRIHRESRELGVEDRVELAGERESADFLPRFDVYVQPSLYESQGLSILEAMAAGIPVVATRVGGVEAVVRHEKTGLLVGPADAAGLASAVRRIRVSSDLARSLAREAWLMVSAEFSLDRMVREYEQLYLSLLAR